jgi:putative restriction endonuclease
MTGKDLSFYTSKMGRLRVDRNPSRYTAGKAPHKPILLFSLIILEENGKQDLHDIKPDLNLRETWSELWKCLEYEKPGPIHLPLYHMKSDGFWNLELKEGVVPVQPKSLSILDSMVNRISMNEDLIHFIEDENSRDRIISSLLNGGYFSEEERGKLKQKIEDLNGSFQYESELIQKVKEEFSPMVQMEAGNLLPSRDPAFRRIVLGAYSETCAVCGLQLQTSSGISVIDAAHILPFNRFHNDDIRNGLALCKMHHWLFDRGILSVDNHYRVLVSKNIEREHPDNIVSRYHKEDIELPESSDHYPHPRAIEWHRENVFDS